MLFFLWTKCRCMRCEPKGWQLGSCVCVCVCVGKCEATHTPASARSKDGVGRKEKGVQAKVTGISSLHAHTDKKKDAASALWSARRSRACRHARFCRGVKVTVGRATTPRGGPRPQRCHPRSTSREKPFLTSIAGSHYAQAQHRCQCSPACGNTETAVTHALRTPQHSPASSRVLSSCCCCGTLFTSFSS